MSDPLESFFDAICGDLPRDELVTVILPNGELEIVMVMIDVEMDPVRITFDCDGGHATIHFDGCKYVMLSYDQLEALSAAAACARDIWDEFNDKPRGDADGNLRERDYRKWLAMGDSGADLRSLAPPRPPRGSKPKAVVP